MQEEVKFKKDDCFKFRFRAELYRKEYGYGPQGESGPFTEENMICETNSKESVCTRLNDWEFQLQLGSDIEHEKFPDFNDQYVSHYSVKMFKVGPF